MRWAAIRPDCRVCQLERRLGVKWVHQQLFIPGQAQFLADPDQVAINVVAGAQHGNRHVMAGGNFRKCIAGLDDYLVPCHQGGEINFFKAGLQ